MPWAKLSRPFDFIEAYLSAVSCFKATPQADLAAAEVVLLLCLARKLLMASACAETHVQLLVKTPSAQLHTSSSSERSISPLQASNPHLQAL